MSDKLVCTKCDEIVWLEVGYDGYSGQCSHASFSMSPGGSDRPYPWEKFGDVQSPTNFKVTGGEWDDELGGFADQEAICLSCDDGGDVSVKYENVGIWGLDKHSIKVTFTCSSEHGIRGTEQTSVAYYEPSYRSGDFIPEKYYAWEEDCDE